MKNSLKFSSETKHAFSTQARNCSPGTFSPRKGILISTLKHRGYSFCCNEYNYSNLNQINNVEFVSNPAVVSLDGIKVLIYHGESFNELPMAIKGLSYEKNELMMEELLRKRHLAPIYGERTPLASELEDYLVIEHVPDIFHTGHIHINSYKKYNGIHMINSGTFQTQTDYQKIKNIEPTPAQVPVIHKGQYKLFRFID